MQQHIHHHRAAVALQFEHILAGEGIRAGEEEQQAFVDNVAIIGMERPVVRMARLRLAPAQGNGHGAGTGTGDADNAHPATALSGGNGGDGFTGCIHVGGLAVVFVARGKATLST